MTRQKQFQDRRRLIGAIALGPLSAAVGNAREPIRSVANARTLLPDALLSPRSPKRVTHRGWEIRERTYTIVANGGEAEARYASRHFREAWDKTLRLADNFQSMHRQVGFANASTLVFFDSYGVGEGRRTQQYPVGSQFVVHVCPSAGRRENPISQSEVHRGATAAFLHACNLDASLPNWFSQGLQSYIDHTFDDDFQTTAAVDRPLQIPQPNRWTRTRKPRFRDGASRFNEPVASEVGAMGAWVQFLLEADGGRYAARTFKALADGPNAKHRLAQLRQSLTASFDNWREQPSPPPSLFPVQTGSEKSLRLQADLFTLLRLARRWSQDEERQPASTIGTTSLRVHEFKAADANTVPAADATKTPNAQGDESLSEAVDMSPVRQRFLHSSWSINAPGGGWLDERAAKDISDRLQLDTARVGLQRSKTHWTVRYQWDRSTELIGEWFEKENEPGMITFRLRSFEERKPVTQENSTTESDT